jgi:aldose 1-epimerase
MTNDILQYTLTNANGMIVKIINYGGTITNVLVPGENGQLADVVLGFDTPEEYKQKENPFFGCITGRYANRISRGKFSIDGNAYQLPVNNGKNTLHGGINGFNRKIWNGVVAGNSLTLTYTSEDGEEGFPGTLSNEVVYTLTDQNELKISYTASTDKPTIINLTNHTYFNLSSDITIEGHEIMINGDRFVAVNEEYLPTGELENVQDSIMDFRIPKSIGKDLPEIKGGFDHTWVPNKKNTGVPELAGALYHPGSKRYLEVFTTQPGMQFYTGNFLNGTLTGKNGLKYPRHAGLCLETQHFPDSPNQPSFPKTIIRPGETFRQTTIYKFSVK